MGRLLCPGIARMGRRATGRRGSQEWTKWGALKGGLKLDLHSRNFDTKDYLRV